MIKNLNSEGNTKTSLLKKTLLVLFGFMSLESFAQNPFNVSEGSYDWFFAIAIVFLVIITASILNFAVRALRSGKKKNRSDMDFIQSSMANPSEAKTVTFFLSLFFAFFILVYLGFRGTQYQAHVEEWMNLVVRWLHVVFGIAWIGASFYFNFLENSLNRTEGLRDEIAGNLWAVHGGGFYFLEKYKIAPKELPKKLHWFKYEAYFTWVSGVSLLAIVYYLNAEVYMVDPEVWDIPGGAAVFLGIVSLIVGWIVYDFLCKSLLNLNPSIFWLILFLFIAGFAWLYLHMFNARAAYIHVGALIGTMMVGNVFRVIIPNQKAMVNSAKMGVMPDPSLGKRGLMRSRHNNFLTLPVIFIMISNHFPSTFGNSLNWFILIGLSLSSVLVNQYLNRIEKGEKAVWIMPIAVVAMISLAFISAPRTKSVCNPEQPVTFAQAQEVIVKRCVQCHSASPTDDVFKVAPNDVKFDTPEECATYSDRIFNRAVINQTMPQGNKTGMTQEERDIIQCWVQSGASIEQ